MCQKNRKKGVTRRLHQASYCSGARVATGAYGTIDKLKLIQETPNLSL